MTKICKNHIIQCIFFYRQFMRSRVEIRELDRESILKPITDSQKPDNFLGSEAEISTHQHWYINILCLINISTYAEKIVDHLNNVTSDLAREQKRQQVCAMVERHLQWKARQKCLTQIGMY